MLDVIKNLLPRISTFVIMQSFLMAIYLFTVPKNKKIENKILGFYFLALATRLFGFDPVGLRMPHQYYFYLGILTMTYFLFAPLFYWYFKSVFEPKFKFKLFDLFHLIPFVFFTVYYIFNLKRFWGFLDIDLSDYVFTETVFSIQMIIYLSALFIDYRHNQTEIKNHFSQTKKTYIFWLYFFFWGNIVQWLFKILAMLFVLKVLYVSSWCGWLSSIIWLNTFLFINSVVFIALKNSEIFLSRRKSQNGLLTESQLKKHNRKLISLMEEEKIYLDSNLSLPVLAKAIKLSTNHLSYLINKVYQQNFFDFINQYRIEESKNLIALNNGEKVNILEIAYQVGFNSKSTFNTAFKKFTGCTPVQYKKGVIQ